MKLFNILAVLLVLIAGCSIQKDVPSEPATKTAAQVRGVEELVLDEQDQKQLGVTSVLDAHDREQLGITNNGTDCQMDQDYANIVDASLGQHGICLYNITSLNSTTLIVELSKFSNLEELNGSYQYNSLHLFSSEGIISENDFGDQSRFRANNVKDYGGELNDPNMYYYHLWICKGEYLIHITSGGRSKEAKDYVASTGRRILSKFD